VAWRKRREYLAKKSLIAHNTQHELKQQQYQATQQHTAQQEIVPLVQMELSPLRSDGELLVRVHYEREKQERASQLHNFCGCAARKREHVLLLPLLPTVGRKDHS
jgi:hypothetical protein